MKSKRILREQKNVVVDTWSKRLDYHKNTWSKGKCMRSEQVLYLTVSLNKPYKPLKILNSNIKVNLNMFCELTPQNTRLFDSIPHVYLYICHETICLLLAES